MYLRLCFAGGLSVRQLFVANIYHYSSPIDENLDVSVAI